MARPVAPSGPLPSSTPDTTSINLERILARLDRNLLLPDGNPKLRSSGFERAKVGANLEHARSLLLRLEHESADIRVQSKKQSALLELQAKREHIKRLTQRLYELNQLDDSDSDSGSGSEDDDEGEDLFPSYAPAKQVSSGIEASQGPEKEALRDAAENLTSSLRARKTQPTPATGNTAKSTSTGTTTGSAAAKNALFSGAGKTKASTETTTASTEAAMSHNRNEQEDLTVSLFKMAQALTAQSLKFNESLQVDSEVVDRAVEGLDKNKSGMDTAGQKMGTLRRMTEGKGWLARLKLYGLIAGLWVLAFLIVFIMPKLRF